MDLQEYIKIFDKTHNKKYSYILSKYITPYVNIKVMCPEHDVFFIQPYFHARGIGCYKCSGLTDGVFNTLTFFKKNKYEIMSRIDEMLLCNCKKHGKFMTTRKLYCNWENVINGINKYVCLCKFCNKKTFPIEVDFTGKITKYDNYHRKHIEKILIDNNIIFEKSKKVIFTLSLLGKVKDAEDGLVNYYDFYMEKYKCFIFINDISVNTTDEAYKNVHINKYINDYVGKIMLYVDQKKYPLLTLTFDKNIKEELTNLIENLKELDAKYAYLNNINPPPVETSNKEVVKKKEYISKNVNVLKEQIHKVDENIVRTTNDKKREGKKLITLASKSKIKSSGSVSFVDQCFKSNEIAPRSIKNIKKRRSNVF